MYGGMGRGMGDGLDWDALLNTTISTAGKVATAAENQLPIGYNGYTVTTGTIAGMDTTTLLMLGVGAFFLIKAMKR